MRYRNHRPLRPFLQASKCTGQSHSVLWPVAVNLKLPLRHMGTLNACRQGTAFLMLFRKLGIIVMSLTVSDTIQVACAVLAFGVPMLKALSRTHPISAQNGWSMLLLSQLLGIVLPVSMTMHCDSINLNLVV